MYVRSVHTVRIRSVVKEYSYHYLSPGRFLVKRKLIKNGKTEHKEYHVDLINGEVFCDCKWFYYTKKKCKHIKDILDMLYTKKHVDIINYNSDNSWCATYILNHRKHLF